MGAGRSGVSQRFLERSRRFMWGLILVRMGQKTGLSSVSASRADSERNTVGPGRYPVGKIEALRLVVNPPGT